MFRQSIKYCKMAIKADKSSARAYLLKGRFRRSVRPRREHEKILLSLPKQHARNCLVRRQLVESQKAKSSRGCLARWPRSRSTFSAVLCLEACRSPIWRPLTPPYRLAATCSWGIDVMLVAELHRRVHAALDGSTSSHAIPATSSGATVNSGVSNIPSNSSVAGVEPKQLQPDAIPVVRNICCKSDHLHTQTLVCARNLTPNTYPHSKCANLTRPQLIRTYSLARQRICLSARNTNSVQSSSLQPHFNRWRNHR